MPSTVDSACAASQAAIAATSNASSARTSRLPGMSAAERDEVTVPVLLR
jgi:hypothetical protein